MNFITEISLSSSNSSSSSSGRGGIYTMIQCGRQCHHWSHYNYYCQRMSVIVVVRGLRGVYSYSLIYLFIL